LLLQTFFKRLYLFFYFLARRSLSFISHPPSYSPPFPKGRGEKKVVVFLSSPKEEYPPISSPSSGGGGVRRGRYFFYLICILLLQKDYFK